MIAALSAEGTFEATESMLTAKTINTAFKRIQ
jgi:hypothetical protein